MKNNKNPKQKSKKHLSQVFLRDEGLVKELIARSSITKKDLVLEIGPGTGVITKHLLNATGSILAVEIDHRLVTKLKKKYATNERIEIKQGDILDLELPTKPYKVFSNIPFAVEGKIIRKLLHAVNPLVDAYIIARKKYAERWVGAKREGQFSILHKPWFKLSIFHYFKRSNFKPKPKVESVMVRIEKRKKGLVAKSKKQVYKKFIKQGFGGGRRIKQNLKLFFSPADLRKVAQQQKFSINSKPSDLSLNQWLSIFRVFQA